MGPWTERAREWLPSGALPQILGLRRSSVVFDASVAPEGCLLHSGGGEFSVYPRPDGQVYMSGVTENPQDCPLPEDSGKVKTNEQAAEAIKMLGMLLCPALRSSPIACTQSWFMPVAGVGMPLIGPVPECSGSVLVGTGHGPWGILNGPATGLALAEIIADGKASSVDLRAFDVSLVQAM